jgi:hypothetical protein
VVFDGPLVNVVLPDQKAGEHRIWVNDWAGAVYSRALLFDADSGNMLGAVETGWEGVKLDLTASTSTAMRYTCPVDTTGSVPMFLNT